MVFKVKEKTYLKWKGLALRVFQQRPNEVFTTSEIDRRTGSGHQTAEVVLDRMESEGLVYRKVVGIFTVWGLKREEVIPEPVKPIKKEKTTKFEEMVESEEQTEEPIEEKLEENETSESDEEYEINED